MRPGSSICYLIELNEQLIVAVYTFHAHYSTKLLLRTAFCWRKNDKTPQDKYGVSSQPTKV